MKTFFVGNAELIRSEPNKNFFRYFQELENYLAGLGTEFKITQDPINKFLKKELEKLQVFESFSKLYGVKVVVKIEVIVDGEFIAFIDDEDEIKNFYEDGECFGFSERGDEIDIYSEACTSIEQSEFYECYIYREK